jgi:hypothetical protein
LIPDLVKSRVYRLRYRVENVNGWSPYSDITMVKTAVAPGKPPKPVLIEATSTSIHLQFFKPVDNGGDDITQFTLYINDGNS